MKKNVFYLNVFLQNVMGVHVKSKSSESKSIAQLNLDLLRSKNISQLKSSAVLEIETTKKAVLSVERRVLEEEFCLHEEEHEEWVEEAALKAEKRVIEGDPVQLIMQNVLAIQHLYLVSLHTVQQNIQHLCCNFSHHLVMLLDDTLSLKCLRISTHQAVKIELLL